MAISEMRRVYVIGHDRDRDGVIQRLQALGVMEVGDITQRAPREEDFSGLMRPYGPVPDRAGHDSMAVNLRYGIDALAQYAPKKNILISIAGSLIEGIFGAKDCISAEEWRKVGENLPRHLKVCDRCRELESGLAKLRAERAKLFEVREQIFAVKGLRYPLEFLGHTNRTARALVSVDSKRHGAMLSDLDRGPAHYIEPVGPVAGREYFMMVCLLEDEVAIWDILGRHDATRLPEFGLKGRPAEIIGDIDHRLEEIALEQGGIRKGLEDLAGERGKLLAAYDYVGIHRAALEAAQGLGRTDETFIIEGWAMRADLEHLKAGMKGAAVIDRAPAEGEMPPVMLENRTLFRPFQVVTNIYGKPKYAEVDPSAFMAPFFLLFFALCIGDAAYGLVLLAISLVGYYKIQSGRRFFRLMMMCSVITIVIGLLMGGFLGNNLVRIDAVWLDPLKDPASFLLFALALGVLHAVIVGPGIRLCLNLKERRYADAVFDQLAWMVLILSLMLYVLVMQNLLATALGRVFMLDPATAASLGSLGKSLEPVFMAAAAASAAVIALTRNRDQKFGGKRLVAGLANLYNVTGYMSDILSYSRILALGMGTAVIAIVVNELAFMALEMHGVGIIIAVAVLVVGHTFNLVMGTLGAFVHTARLQFIEFFGKFMEGGGRTFKPFCERKKYVEVME